MKTPPAPDYQSLFERIPGLYLVLLPDFTITAVSDAYLDATMTKRDNILGHGLFEIFPDNPDDNNADGVSNLRASLNYVRQYKQPHAMATQKYDIRRPDGVFEERYWSPLNTPVVNEQEELTYIIHNVTDVTSGKKSDEKLKKSEKDYQLLVSSVKDYAIYMLDEKGRVKHWNTGAEHMKGYTEEEIIGKPLDIFYTAEEKERGEPQRNLQRALQQGYYETEGLRVRKDGSTFYAHIVFTSLFDESGKPFGYAKVTRDITEKRKAEEHIRLLASIAGNIQDPVIASDNNFCTTSWNEAAEKLLEWKSEEVIGKPTREILRVIYPDHAREQILQSFTENGYWQGEVIYHTKSGKPVNILATASQLKDANENVTGILVLARDITDRKKAEKQLEEFEHFFNNSHDLCGIANTVGYFEIINTNFCKVLGYSEKEFCETPFIELIHPDDIAITLHEYEKLKAGELTINFINRYRKKDGSYLYLDWNATPNPLTGKLYCVARDITDRKKAEDALSRLNEELEQRVKERTEEIIKNEKRFRALIENNYDIISLMNEQFKVIYRSPSASKITGWRDEEIIKKEGTSKIHSDDREKASSIIKELMANPGKTINTLFRTQHKQGHYLWMEGTVINLLQDKDVKAIVFNFRDVTGRVEAETKLIASEERFRSIIDQYPSPVVRYTADGTYITANPAWEIMWEDKRENVIGYNIRKDPQMIASGMSKNIEQAFAGNVASSEVYLYDPAVIGKSGRKRWIQLLVYPLKDIEGKILEVILITLDMTDNREAEEKLVQSELRFRSLIENSTEGISLTDEFNNLIYRSPASQKITGVMSTDNMLSRIDPKYLKEIKSKIAEVISKPGVPVPFQARFLHTEGHYYWMEGTITNMLHVNGVNAIVSNYHDITQRKQLEDLLHKANILARIGGWEVDMIKGTVYWSDITREIHETEHNYVPDLQTGINFYKEGKERDLITQKVKEAIEFGKSWDMELQIVTAKNNDRWIRTIGETEFVNGKCVRIYGSFQDINQRKKAEEKLIESEKLYRNLFTNMLHGFAYCKVIYQGDQLIDYTYLAVNREYEELTGLKGITGKKMSEVIPDLLESDPDYIRLMNKVASYGKSEKFETYVAPLRKWFSVSLYSPEKGYFVTLVDNITQRKQTEEKILASEKQFRTTLDNMLEGAQIIGFDWRYLYVNDSFIRHSKYSREELIGHTVMEKFPGIEQTEIFKVYQRCFNERVSIHLENELTFPDKTVGWFELSFQPVPEGIFILSIDITDRKKSEEALLRSEARARRIFESDMIGFIFWNEKGQILEANDYFLRMTGYSREDLERGLVNWAAMTPPEYENLDIIALEQIADTGICKPFEKEYIRKDGSRFPISLGAAALGTNFDGVGVCYVMNISERIKAAETIAETLKEKNIILESIGDAFFAVDKDWTVTYWNRIAEIALGVLKQDIVGKNLWEIFSDSIESISYEKYHQALATNQVVHFEDFYAALHKWYEISAYPSENGLSVYFKDVTERQKAAGEIKKLNADLEEKVINRTEELKKANEELEAFTYSVSHDLRAPLRGIIGFTTILEEDYSSKLDEEARRITSVIKSNTLKMGNLIDDLLTFSRMGRQDIEKNMINTNEMVKEIINNLENKNTAGSIEWVISSLHDSYGDSNALRQVWTNLISNAIKYSGGRTNQHIEIGSALLKGQTSFFIKDNGVGFDIKYSSKLFKVFQRLHGNNEFEGTGVGLAIVEKIVSKHGGKVWATGEVDKGAVFYFSLPVRQHNVQLAIT